jgi:hypothetical protein
MTAALLFTMFLSVVADAPSATTTSASQAPYAAVDDESTNAAEEYPTDLLMNQILWGGLVYLLGEVGVAIFAPLILVVPFVTGFTVSEVGVGAGYASDWFLPGLAAFGGALVTGLATWGGACGICIASGAASSVVSRAGSSGAGSGLALAGICGSVGCFVIGAFAQPFAASTAAAFTYKARAKPKTGVALAPVAPMSRGRAVAMAF